MEVQEESEIEEESRIYTHAYIESNHGFPVDDLNRDSYIVSLNDVTDQWQQVNDLNAHDGNVQVSTMRIAFNRVNVALPVLKIKREQIEGVYLPLKAVLRLLIIIVRIMIPHA